MGLALKQDYFQPAIIKPREPQTPMTAEEFWDWPGDGSGALYELVQGQPRLMTYASDAHGTIQVNIARHLANHLDGTPCRAITNAGVQPRIDQKHNVRVPDVVVTCEPPEKGKRAVRQPLVIVEVISPSNRDDTMESLSAVATIGSVEELLIVESEAVGARVVRREGRDFVGIEHLLGPDDPVRLDSINATLTMAQIYAGTGLLDAEADPEADESDQASGSAEGTSNGD